MEAMAGYDRAILVDAIQTEGGKPGTIYALEPADVAQTRNIHSTHDGSLAVALELGRMAGIRMPAEIRIWAVEAGDAGTFSESLTEEVARAVPRVVESIIAHLRIERLPYQERRHENSRVFL
jgi:hydrogenase maturation protease